jgi:hypothetical protein
MADGIIVGSDQTQEWLLPWWWDHYARHNSYPVTFIDFGLSLERKAWCRERGELIALRVVDFATEPEEIAPPLVKEWEGQFGKSFWPSRGVWFKKPLACLRAPFERSIWIDLDCEIRGSVAPLFDLAEHPSGIALAKASFDELKACQIYNSGVIVFRQKLLLIEEWASQSVEQNHAFRGDQELLSHLIAQKKLSIGEVPQTYNWSRYHGDEPNAIIYHWHGEFGRSVIKHQLWAKGLTL